MTFIDDLAKMAGETKQPELIASVSVFLPLAIAAVALRIWVRTRMIRNFGWDDVTMIVALANFIVYCSAIMYIVAHGGGTHLTHLKNVRLSIIWVLVAEVAYLITILFLKVSLGLFFLRVIQVKWQRKVVYATMIISTIVQTYHAFFYVFSCGNPKYYAEHMIERTCISKRIQVDLAYEQAAITTATDFVFAFLPIPLLWNTTMDLRSKLSVAFVLLLGTTGSVCSIIRFKYIEGLGSIDDFFWTAANISIWSLFEMGTGIVAGSLAAMRPLFKKIMYKARSLTQAGKTLRNDDGVESSRARILSREKSSASSMSRSQKTVSEWTRTFDNRTYTATCIDGHDLESAAALADLDERGAQLIKLREERIYPKEIWSKDPERSQIWPYAEDESIHRMVQSDVRSSQESEPWAGAGGGLWGRRMEDILKTPPRTRKSSRDDDSIPEWEKLPDLIPPSRKGSEDSQRRNRLKWKSNNYAEVAARYHTVGVKAPPPWHLSFSKNFRGPAENKDINQSKHDGIVVFEIPIPKGYVAWSYSIATSYIHGDIDVGPRGGNIFDDLCTVHGMKSDGNTEIKAFDAPFPSTSISVSLATINYVALSGTIRLNLARMPETFAKWQLETYDAIATAYTKARAEWLRSVAESVSTGFSPVSGNNPLENTTIIRTELKKSCISMLSMQNFDGFGSIKGDSHDIPQIDNYDAAAAQGSYIQFIEQAFEWENLQYELYPYFWGRKELWANRMGFQAPDATFANFVKAGAARISLPARLGFSRELSTVVSEDYKHLANEIAEAEKSVGKEALQGDPWFTVVPTSLVRLRKDDKLLGWEFDSKTKLWIEVNREEPTTAGSDEDLDQDNDGEDDVD